MEGGRDKGVPHQWKSSREEMTSSLKFGIIATILLRCDRLGQGTEKREGEEIERERAVRGCDVDAHTSVDHDVTMLILGCDVPDVVLLL